MSEEAIVVEEMKGLNPYTEALFKPREVIRYISGLHEIPFYWVLVYLTGLIAGFDNLVRDPFNLFSINVALLLLFATVTGLIQIYFGGWVISWFGKLFGGVATNADLRVAVLWSRIPVIMTMPIIIFTTIIQSENFNYLLYTNVIVTVLFWLCIFLETLLAVWCFINLVRMISEVQDFSKTKAFLSIILPGIIFVAIIIVLILFFR